MLGIALKIVGLFLGYATKRDDSKTALALENIRGEISANVEKSNVTRAKLSHVVAWIPAFIIEASVAVYIATQMLDITFDLIGDVAPPSTEMAAIVSAVIASMTLKKFSQ